MAGGNDVATDAASAAGNGDDVVHGKFLRREGLAAVVAFSDAKLRLPPFAGAQLARLLAFAGHVLGIGMQVVPVVHGRS